jgi:4,5-DOPA dioxygenase extradiol
MNMAKPMPAVFFGHGDPMNALDRNEYTEGCARIGNQPPRPKAILCVSAHWYFPATAVTSVSRPRTIHDRTARLSTSRAQAFSMYPV